jgi:hypothetical protein
MTARRASLEKNKKRGFEKRAATLATKRIESEADEDPSE